MASSERAKTRAEAGTKTRPETGTDYTAGHEGESSTDKAATIDGIDALRFEAIRNGRYHLARQGWYERWHRIAMFVVVIGGTAAVAQAVGEGKHSALVALIPTLAGTIDLLFDFAGKAALHARLQERSYEIISEIELAADSRETICRRGWSSMARIWAQEPKTMRVVEALAYNDTKEGTTENAEGELLVVSGWAKFWRHVCAFDGLPMRRAKDIKKAAQISSSVTA